MFEQDNDKSHLEENTDTFKETCIPIQGVETMGKSIELPLETSFETSPCLPHNVQTFLSTESSAHVRRSSSRTPCKSAKALRIETDSSAILLDDKTNQIKEKKQKRARKNMTSKVDHLQPFSDSDDSAVVLVGTLVHSPKISGGIRIGDLISPKGAQFETGPQLAAIFNQNPSTTVSNRNYSDVKPKLSKFSKVGKDKPDVVQIKPFYLTSSSNGTESSESSSENKTADDAPAHKKLRQSNKSSGIWEYFESGKKTPNKQGQSYQCRHCKRAPISAQNTSGLLQHWKSCPGRFKAWLENAPGARECKKEWGQQILVADQTGSLVQSKSFSVDSLFETLIRWIINHDMPFSTLEHEELREAFCLANPSGILWSAKTVSTGISDTYAALAESLKSCLSIVDSQIHICHDIWTSKDYRNSYLGIVVTFIDCDFVYQEYLLKLVVINQKHSGHRIASAIYKALSSRKIQEQIGCITSDNASNNATTAVALDELINESSSKKRSGLPFQPIHELQVPCVAHVLNLAVRDFLVALSELDLEDYFLFAEKVPDIAITAPEMMVDDDENSQSMIDKDSSLADSDSEGSAEDLTGISDPEGSDVGSDDSAYDLLLAQRCGPLERPRESDSLFAKNDDALHEADIRTPIKISRRKENILRSIQRQKKSPIGKVRTLTKFILASTQRRSLFIKTLHSMQPELGKGVLPVKDVATRWNWTLEMIERALTLQKRMTTFCSHESEAVALSPGDWAALIRIKNVLDIFRQATLQVSARGCGPDFILVIYKRLLVSLEASKTIEAKFYTQRERWGKAIDICSMKIHKYVDKSLSNDYICMALMLKPSYRFEGMRKVMKWLGASDDRCLDILDVTVSHMENQTTIEERLSQPNIDLKAGATSDFNKLLLNEDAVFGSESINDTGKKSPRDILDSYNKGLMMMKENEETLDYWRRARYELPTLSKFARDVLGVSPSSVNVERIFSATGNTTQNYHRGRLTARNIVKSASSKIFMQQGLQPDPSRGYHRLKRKLKRND